MENQDSCSNLRGEFDRFAKEMESGLARLAQQMEKCVIDTAIKTTEQLESALRSWRESLKNEGGPSDTPPSA